MYGLNVVNRGLIGQPPSAPASRAGFTLVELLVSIAIITLILVTVVPSVESMWGQRKLSETENILRGALNVARQRAIGGTESGLLFFVDPEGVQRVFPIEREDEPIDNPADPPSLYKLRGKYNIKPNAEEVHNDLLSANRFRISAGRGQSLLPPIRVIPRYAVLEGLDGEADRFSEKELINNDFVNAPSGVDPAQRHRNFFSIIFSTEGRLVVGRDVLVFDEDGETNHPKNAPGNGFGDLTGLRVDRTSFEYLSQTGPPFKHDIYPQPISPPPNLVHLLSVYDGDVLVAANFPSVDGVIVYDDGLYQRSGGQEQRRPFLTNTGKPYYISRVTGDIIRGPLGDNEDPSS